MSHQTGRGASSKTVHGKQVTQDQFLNTIVKALAQMENQQGVAGDLIPALGPEYDNLDGRRVIKDSLRNMWRRGTLKKTDRGVYTIAGNFALRGVSHFDASERAILDVIRDLGGVARWYEIMGYFGVRVKARDAEERRWLAQDPEHYHINRVLQNSPNIKQDLLRQGYYNLPWPEFLACVANGRALTHFCQMGFHIAQTGCEDIKVDAWEEHRNELLKGIGFAVVLLREQRGIETAELARVPAVAAALLAFKNMFDEGERAIKTADQHYLDQTAAGRRKRLADGWTETQTADWEDQRESERVAKRPITLLRLFEDGNANVHMGAPVALYKAIATEFQVCPVSLSRGMVWPLPPEERIKPTSRMAPGVRDAGDRDFAEYEAAMNRDLTDTKIDPRAPQPTFSRQSPEKPVKPLAKSTL
jgi:hypothetical protein